MPLTDAKVRNAKPDTKPAKISDGGGLHVLVTPSGSKLWRLAYRYSGKQKTLALGGYPAVSLEMAREGRQEAKRLLAEGIDPSDPKREEKLRAQASAENTFEAIGCEYLLKLEREGRARVTLDKVRWLLDMANERLRNRPVTDISSADLLEVLRRVEQRGHLETAGRLRSTDGSVMRYAIATARTENDPTVALRGGLVAPKVKHHAAITDRRAMGGLMRAIDGFDGQITIRASLQLLALLFPRPGELRAAEWSEFDLGAGVRTIPAARTKMRREHRVPLSAQAVAILRDLKELHMNEALVFPSVRTSRRCMSENTLNAALRHLGFGNDEVTSHGFRATASTLLNESGKWAPDVVIERQLASFSANLEVSDPQAQRELGEFPSPCLSEHIEQEPESHA